MNKAIFLLISICIFSQSFGKDLHYYFQRISPEYGLSHDAIGTITEDKNGFLWFGSYDGVYYYNTLEIKKIHLFRRDTSPVSYPRIMKIYRDDNDQLWTCSNSGLFEYNSDQNCFYQKTLYFPDLTPMFNQKIENILQLDENKYFVVSRETGYLYHKGDSVLEALDNKNLLHGKDISFISKDKSNFIFGTVRGAVYLSRNTYTSPELFYSGIRKRISSVCRDGNKYFVGYIENGVAVVNLNGEKIHDYNEAQKGQFRIGNRVRDIIKRDNGEIWIGAYKGLYILRNEKVTHFNFQSNVGLPQSSIYVLHKGREGGIWLGTWAGGIAYFHDLNYNFAHVDPIAVDGNKFQNSVTSFAEDPQGIIWIGSERKGMNLFKTKLDEIDKNLSPVYNYNYGINTVRTLEYLKNDKLLIGTFDEGLLYFDPISEKIEHAFDEINNNMTSASYNNDLWIGGFHIYKIDLRTNKMQDMTRSLKRLNINVHEIRYLFFDSAHNLWICTNAGLFVKYKNSDDIKQCSINIEGETTNTSIYTCLEDIEGRIWLGTRGKGILIYQPYTDSGSRMFINETINESDIYSLIKDNNDALWFSTNHGIFRYVNDYNQVYQFTEYDGLSGRQFNPNAAFICSDGRLLFGSPNGFNVINPQIIKQNTKRPEVFLAKLLVNNEPFSKNNTVSCNSFNIGLLKRLKLNYQPNLNIEVIANNYIKSEKNRFKYRLVNYDDNWHEIAKGKEIIYTKLPPGKYIFEAYGSNNDQLWSSEPYRLELIVREPLWRRWYSIFIYILILSSLVLVVLRFYGVRSNLKKEIDKERYKNQVNETISAERVKFFLNISHEIRTPLSLIISPIHMLMSKFKYDDKATELLRFVDKNAQRLVKLTDQTLDYRLLEEGKLEPNFETVNIIELATDAYRYFEQLISEKQIEFSFVSGFKRLEIQVDIDMVEKIIFNLLSNAIKFTSEKGSIILSIERTMLTNESYNNCVFVGKKFLDETLELRISDTGKGIKPENFYSIFERFTKDVNKQESGSGIGLHLCKEYAVLNNGNIMLLSEEGKGSVFILNLPLRHAISYENNKNKNKQIIAHSATNLNHNLGVNFNSQNEVSANRSSILLIEPNNEFRQYLRIFLSAYYNVISSKSANQALEILTNIQPDLIISELEFSGIDGLDFILKVRSQESLKNIPIIILTAHSNSSYHLKSIVNGANTYFTKPIDDSLLLAEIKKHLISQQQRTTQESAPIKQIPVKGLAVEPETFIAFAEKIVEENCQNINFNSKTLAEMLYISQSTLFRKIKKQTSLSCTEFIREVKLKRAISLLKNSTMNIDEIALTVGFNSTSYFVRSFKKKYHKTPSEYRKL